MHPLRLVPALIGLVACVKGPDRVDTARRNRLDSMVSEVEKKSAVASSSATAAASTPSGCSTITEAEATAALGQPSRYRPLQPTPAACTIEPASGDAFHGTTVDFRVTQGTAQFDFLAAQKQSQQIGGLGDRAVWLAAGKIRGNLAVIRGSTVVTLTITDLAGHGRLEQKARDFARLVLEHL